MTVAHRAMHRPCASGENRLVLPSMSREGAPPGDQCPAMETTLDTMTSSLYVSSMAPEHQERDSASDIVRRRAASRDLTPGLTVLVGSEASLIALNPDASASGWHLAWALSPLVGLGLLVWAQIRMLGRSDERERAQELSAMAIGFGVVMVALAVVGVLQAAGVGHVRQQLLITTGLGIGAWVIASLLLKRRAS